MNREERRAARRFRNWFGWLLPRGRAELERMNADERLQAMYQALTAAQAGMDAEEGARKADAAGKVGWLLKLIDDAERKAGGETTDPDELEPKALEFLRGRGWRCER